MLIPCQLIAKTRNRTPFDHEAVDQYTESDFLYRSKETIFTQPKDLRRLMYVYNTMLSGIMEKW